MTFCGHALACHQELSGAADLNLNRVEFPLNVINFDFVQNKETRVFSKLTNSFEVS